MSNYEIFVYGWIAIGFLSFPFILRYDAPYGRHTSNNWGPLVDNKIGWIVMELPALIVCPLLVLSSSNPLSDVTKFFIILWVIHYFNRSVIFPLRIKTKKKKHLQGDRRGEPSAIAEKAPCAPREGLKSGWRGVHKSRKTS